MSDTINLLPEDLQAKGYIPQPKAEPVSQPVEMKTNVSGFNGANEVVNEIKISNNNSSFDKVEDIAPMPQKPMANIVRKAPAPVKSSFWDNLFGQKKTVTSYSNNKPTGVGLSGGVQPKKKFSFKAILNWLTAGSGGNSSNQQDDFGINLVHAEAETLPLKTIGLKIFLRVLPAIIIIVATYFVAHFYSSNIKAKTEDMVDKLSKTVIKSEEEIARLENNASGVDKKVSIMRNIFDRHIYWTRLLDFLEESFIAEVYIKSLTAENSGNLIIEAQADSFTSVAKQYLVLQNNKNIKEVSITGADKSGDEDRVSFSIKLKIWPGIMYPNAYLNKAKN